MKKQIRFGVFETNSSSQHTLTILDENEFKKYFHDSYDENMYWDKYAEKFISKTELIKRFNEYYSKKYYSLDKEFCEYTDEEKIEFMLENQAFYNDDEDCSEVITKEIDMSDGTKKYAISRYTWED